MLVPETSAEMSTTAAIGKLQVQIVRSLSTTQKIMMEKEEIQALEKELDQEIDLEKGLFQGIGQWKNTIETTALDQAVGIDPNIYLYIKVMN